MLSSIVNRDDLHRLNYNKTVFSRGAIRPAGRARDALPDSESDRKGYLIPTVLPFRWDPGHLVLLLKWYSHFLDKSYLPLCRRVNTVTHIVFTPVTTVTHLGRPRHVSTQAVIKTELRREIQNIISQSFSCYSTPGCASRRRSWRTTSYRLVPGATDSRTCDLDRK